MNDPTKSRDAVVDILELLFLSSVLVTLPDVYFVPLRRLSRPSLLESGFRAARVFILTPPLPVVG
jgi:hypothetical protein